MPRTICSLIIVLLAGLLAVSPAAAQSQGDNYFLQPVNGS